ncbi:MAG: dodecin family protein [Candidatus Marinimicrobia bacterium]|nr:dodecin family protein [Candidatus Neomarinimicrobiota bacterium]MCF7829252.1 dodecin family protein [Candidatus Neomarinimicrobiota bacterium]MCF7881095.1 dodecin family protein [Candidatus Neomarinimicrobiota bacterium]
MSGVYKKINLVGTSTDSYEEAIATAINRAEQTLNDLEWFEVEEFRGGISADGDLEYQAVIRAAFKLK